MADHPEEELQLPLAALQVLTTCLAALAAASVAYGAPLWELPWGILLPHQQIAQQVAPAAAAALPAAAATLPADAMGAWMGDGLAGVLAAVGAAPSLDPLADWSVVGGLLYSGVITTALTLWLSAIIFTKLPVVDATVLMTTEPLWACLIAVLALGDRLGPTDYAGGVLILIALAVNQGLIFGGDEGPQCVPVTRGGQDSDSRCVRKV